jgi:hypothetical protein
VVKARQISSCCDDGDGDGQWPASQGLKGLDHRLTTPGVPRLVPCLFEPWQAFSGLVHRPDIFLEDDLWRRGRTHHVRAPAPGGRTPGGLARLAASMPPQPRVEPARGGLEIPDGVCTRSAQIRARLSSRRASSSTCGPETGVRSPERLRRARCPASRRAVLTRAPVVCGITDGATTPHATPVFVT